MLLLFLHNTTLGLRLRFEFGIYDSLKADKERVVKICHQYLWMRTWVYNQETYQIPEYIRFQSGIFRFCRMGTWAVLSS